MPGASFDGGGKDKEEQGRFCEKVFDDKVTNFFSPVYNAGDFKLLKVLASL